jgi:UbiD family decarboxylase
LRVIHIPVDPHLEIAEIHRRVIAAGGPALLFTHPRDAAFPVVTNLFGNSQRVELAFGSRPTTLIRDLARLAETALPPTPQRLWPFRGALAGALRIGQQLTPVAHAPVAHAHLTPPRLARLPLLTSWPEDGGPFITLPLVYTEDPENSNHNLGMYRAQRFDDRTLGMHWQICRGGGFHYHRAESRGHSLPVVLQLGGPPALILSAIAPLPESLGELLLASLVLGRKLPLTHLPSPPHPVIAHPAMALIGSVPPHRRRAEGPFGDHYGYYSLRHDFPFMEVHALHHRKSAIYPATVVGKPKQEDFFLGDYLQELLSPLFPLVMPAVRDLWSYGETGYHSLSAAVVRERYRREAMVSAFRILGEGQLSLTKFLLLTDHPQDLRDFPTLLSHILARARFETDLFIFPNLSMDTLDYSGPRLNEGSKGVLLGLGPPIRDLPQSFSGAVPTGIQEIRVFTPGCLVLSGLSHSDDPDACRRLPQHAAFASWPLLVLVDDARAATASATNFLWTTFTRFDPARDIHAAAQQIVANGITHTGPLLIDARKKPHLPQELFCDPTTAATVDRRWREYFPDGMEMGSSDHAHLTP